MERPDRAGGQIAIGAARVGSDLIRIQDRETVEVRTGIRAGQKRFDDGFGTRLPTPDGIRHRHQTEIVQVAHDHHRECLGLL